MSLYMLDVVAIHCSTKRSSAIDLYAVSSHFHALVNIQV